MRIYKFYNASIVIAIDTVNKISRISRHEGLSAMLKTDVKLMLFTVKKETNVWAYI